MCNLPEIFCKEQVLFAFSYAFGQLLTVDYALFEHNATERTIAARLAMYLRQHYFQYETSDIDGKNYFVDVEYNKAGHGLKNPKGTYRSWTAPDIIFLYNFAVIAMKKIIYSAVSSKKILRVVKMMQIK